MNIAQTELWTVSKAKDIALEPIKNASNKIWQFAVENITWLNKEKINNKVNQQLILVSS